VSPVGNNDVPYPHAIDDTGNVYLLIFNVILTKPDKFKEYGYDYTDYYIDNAPITADIRAIPHKNPTIPNFQNISEYYIGNDRYTLTYEPFPSEDYNRLIPFLFQEMSIKYLDGSKKVLTEESYVKLIEDFGLLQGFEPLIHESIHNFNVPSDIDSDWNC